MKLHHIGYVTDNLKKKSEFLCSLLGLECKNNIVEDHGQDVRILMLDVGSEVQLELIEPLGLHSPVRRHLEKGGGLYHLCFEVEDLDKTLETIQKNRQAIVVKEPLAAPAMGDKRVAFVVTVDKDLIEFVESDKG